MMASRILIIEDDPALLRGLKDNFADRGCTVDSATDGDQGLEMALRGNHDLLLLDIMLPKVNGYEICRALREHGLKTPVIMLTAKGQEEDIILGLNLGADDYVTKPFRIRELSARVKAFLRRARMTDATLARFGDFELNLTAHKLFCNGVEVVMTAKEYQLLAYFV